MISENADLTVISHAELETFKREGYLHLRGIVPEAQLVSIQKPLERWVDAMITTWIAEGLLEHAFHDLPFEKRLSDAWAAAGSPTYSRSPRKEIVSQETFDFISEPVFINLAKDLIGSEAIAAHGAFNCRPKLRNQGFSDTPWHQDAQYFRNCAGNNIITMWMPLMDVDETNSCLQVAPKKHTDSLYDNVSDPTGFIGIPPEVRKTLNGRPIVMNRGDLLCFNEMLPHAALPNTTDTVRWSMDLRYEALGTPNSCALNQGFICAHTMPEMIETSFENWYQTKWVH